MTFLSCTPFYDKIYELSSSLGYSFFLKCTSIIRELINIKRMKTYIIAPWNPLLLPIALSNWSSEYRGMKVTNPIMIAWIITPSNFGVVFGLSDRSLTGFLPYSFTFAGFGSTFISSNIFAKEKHRLDASKIQGSRICGSLNKWSYCRYSRIWIVL